jgi:hypothetical protein
VGTSCMAWEPPAAPQVYRDGAEHTSRSAVRTHFTYFTDVLIFWLN